MREEAADSLGIRVEFPRDVVAGQRVPMLVRVENVKDTTLTLYLVGRTIAFDLIVETPDGAPVWRRLDGEVVPAILRLETLKPGQALVLEDTWDQHSNSGQPLPPGEYRVRAELLTDGDPVSSQVELLRIRAR